MKIKNNITEDYLVARLVELTSSRHQSELAEILKHLLPYRYNKVYGDFQKDAFNAITKFTGVTLSDMQSPRRHHHVVYFRNFFFWLMRKSMGATLTEIGKQVNRDHATVINGVKVFEAMIENEEPYRLVISEIISDLERCGYTRPRAHFQELMDRVDEIKRNRVTFR